MCSRHKTMHWRNILHNKNTRKMVTRFVLFYFFKIIKWCNRSPAQAHCTWFQFVLLLFFCRFDFVFISSWHLQHWVGDTVAAAASTCVRWLGEIGGRIKCNENHAEMGISARLCRTRLDARCEMAKPFLVMEQTLQTCMLAVAMALHVQCTLYTFACNKNVCNWTFIG